MQEPVRRIIKHPGMMAFVIFAAIVTATGALLVRRGLLLNEIAQLRRERDAPMTFTPDGLTPEQMHAAAHKHARRRAWFDARIQRRERAVWRPWCSVPQDAPPPPE